MKTIVSLGSPIHRSSGRLHIPVSIISVLAALGALVALWAPAYLGLLDYFGGALSARSQALEWSLLAVGVAGLASVFYLAWHDTRDPVWRAGSVLTKSTRRPLSASRTALAQASDVLPTPPLPVKNKCRGAVVRNSGMPTINRVSHISKQQLLAVYVLRLRAGKLIVCAQRIPAVHRRRSTSHVDRKGNGLGDLFPAGSMLMGHFRVIGDATVAMDCDADCEGHKLLRLRVDNLGRRRRCRESPKRLHRVRCASLQQSDAGDHIMGDIRKVLAHILLLLPMTLGIPFSPCGFIMEQLADVQS